MMTPADPQGASPLPWWRHPVVIGIAALLIIWIITALVHGANGTASQPSTPRPPGLDNVGSLDVGCKLNGPNATQATITLYDPGSNLQSVSSVGVYWISNGIEAGQQLFHGSWNVPPHSDVNLYASGDFRSNTSCQIAGWNP